MEQDGAVILLKWQRMRRRQNLKEYVSSSDNDDSSSNIIPESATLQVMKMKIGVALSQDGKV
jgi:hypothetical protein